MAISSFLIKKPLPKEPLTLSLNIPLFNKYSRYYLTIIKHILFHINPQESNF